MDDIRMASTREIVQKPLGIRRQLSRMAAC
jgi:hypothetical protein